jgi:hypothetical protein
LKIVSNTTSDEAELPIIDKFIVFSRVPSPKTIAEFDDGNKLGKGRQIDAARRTWTSSWAESLSIPGKLKTLIFRFTKQKIDDLQNAVLLPLYSKMVAPAVADALNSEIKGKARAGLADLDATANAAIGDAVRPIVSLLK